LEIAEDVLREAHKAFRDDDAVRVSQILEQHSELKELINEPLGPFNSPVVTNVRSREMLDVLLEAGADINARSKWWAGGFGILDFVEPELASYAIARGAVIDVHSASRLGQLDTLTSLISENPALIHARGGDGQTPLHFASTVEIAKFLVDHGADIDALDVDHVSSPAQYMVKSRQDVARYLVSRGCKTDILMATALNDAYLVAKILDHDPESTRTRVSEEYFPMISGSNGGTIYQWELGWHVSAHQIAKEFGHEGIFDLLWARSPQDVKLINACWLEDEAAVDGILHESPGLGHSLSDADQRQLAHAARDNKPKAVRLMLRAGLSVSARSQHNGSALHWAAWHGNVPMVNDLLAKGASIKDADNEYKGTPLDWAIHASLHGWNLEEGDYAGTVEALLIAGATVPDNLVGSEAVQAVLARHGSTT